MRRVLWASLVVAVSLAFAGFLRTTARTWFQDETYSYGVLIPAISAHLIWRRRSELAGFGTHPWNLGLGVVLLGCLLRIMGELSGILLVSGAGLIVVLIGMTAYLWGKRQHRLVALPLAFLIFMVPLPSYTLGMISWRLQAGASTVSTTLLQRLGIPVFQDGYLLVLPNYVLAVKEACSGTRSVFALMALAVLLGLLNEHRWVPRLLLFASAPGIALLSNVIRIVGTGVAAYFFGEAAARETLHIMWGIIVFVIGVAGLLAIHKGLQWTSDRFASVSS